MLQPGMRAPYFALETAPNQITDLDDLRGHNSVLIFYPADWSPVCSSEVALFNEALPIFERYNARLFGISVDSAWCHKAFMNIKRIRFPLLADFEPKGKTCRDYGVYRYGDGTAGRALFILDKDLIIRYSYLSPLDENPGAGGVLARLEEMQHEYEHLMT